MPNSIRFGRAAANSGLTRTTNLPPITGFTMMCWGRYLTNQLSLLMTYGTASNANSYAFGLSSGTFQMYNGGFHGILTPLTLGRWYHMAMNVSGTGAGGANTYLNGVADRNDTAQTYTGTKLWLGTNGLSQWWDGNIAAVKIYNRVLTAGEIADEMAYALPVSLVGINSYYPVPGAWDALDTQTPLPSAVTSRWAEYSGASGELTQIGTVDTENGPPIRWAPPRSLYANRRRPFAPSAAPASRRRIVLIG